MVLKRKGDRTRRRLLEVAFEVISRKGFQAAGLGEILTAAGLTKGALYHHFRDKTALGYAVVDEIVSEIIEKRWIAPLVAGGDPLALIARVMRSGVEGLDDRAIELGCPLGNLAAEMSALDEHFAGRIAAIYQKWRDALASVLVSGESAVDDPDRIAAFIVSALAGCLAQAKAAGRRDLLLDGVTELEFLLNQPRTAASEPPEPQYAPAKPGEIEDYLL